MAVLPAVRSAAMIINYISSLAVYLKQFIVPLVFSVMF